MVGPEPISTSGRSDGRRRFGEAAPIDRVLKVEGWTNSPLADRAMLSHDANHGECIGALLLDLIFRKPPGEPPPILPRCLRDG